MNPTELWSAFRDAYYTCPQSSHVFHDSAMENDRTYAEWRKTNASVIEYWTSRHTEGGKTLTVYGYMRHIPLHVAGKLHAYETKLSAERHRIAEEIFGTGKKP